MRERHIDIAFLTETHCKEPDANMSKGCMVIHSADYKKKDDGAFLQEYAGVSVIPAPHFLFMVEEVTLIDGRFLALIANTAQAPLFIF